MTDLFQMCAAENDATQSVCGWELFTCEALDPSHLLLNMKHVVLEIDLSGCYKLRLHGTFSQN